ACPSRSMMRSTPRRLRPCFRHPSHSCGLLLRRITPRSPVRRIAVMTRRRLMVVSGTPATCGYIRRVRRHRQAHGFGTRAGDQRVQTGLLERAYLQRRGLQPLPLECVAQLVDAMLEAERNDGVAHVDARGQLAAPQADMDARGEVAVADIERDVRGGTRPERVLHLQRARDA